MSDRRYTVLICGTDTSVQKGGIAVVLPGYFSALESAQAPFQIIPTFRSGSIYGKWTCWASAFPKLLGAIRRNSKQDLQSIVYTHAGDGVSFFREFWILLWARLLGAHTVLHVHSPKLAGYMETPISRGLIRMAWKPADVVCMLTQWWSQKAKQHQLHPDIRVVHNPLPQTLDREARKPVRIHEITDINLLSMARFVEGKGVDLVIESMRFVPDDVRLTLAGDGPLRKLMEKRVKELGLQNRVHFAGWVSGERKRQLLLEADLFCLPSSYDVFPMSMVEAMAYGIPVIAARWGGIPDVVPDGRAGILVDPITPESIGKAITNLVEDGNLIKMGQFAKRWVLDISSHHKVGVELRQIFQELVV